MKKKEIFISLLLLILISSSTILAFETPITGKVVFSTNPNDLQKIYSRSSPAIAKINVYYGYDVFLPKLTSIDFQYDFNYEYPLYEDLNVRMDRNADGFNNLFGESFWGQFYAGEYYTIDELGNTNTLKLDAIDINKLEQEFQDYHNVALPLDGGTGFLINSEGYLLTNAHVVTLLDSEMEWMAQTILYSNYLAYYYFLCNNANYNDKISIGEYEDFLKKIMFLEENMEIRNIRISRIEIILGEGSNVHKYEAKLIDFNNNYLDETGGRDWALLKIDGEIFPSLPLGNSDKVPIGEDIVVIGYPWTSEGITEKTEDYVASTPTSGKISNLVPSGNYKDLQIDISIEGGNSGGPGLNSEGEVIGIATAGYGGLSGTYNYLTPINDVKKAINVNLQQNKIDTLWNEGLENFWNENYATAKLKFEEVKSINSNHPYVEGILSQLRNLPSTNKETVENNPGTAGNNPGSSGISTVSIIFIVLGTVMVILLILIALKLYGGKIRKRKKKWHDLSV